MNTNGPDRDSRAAASDPINASLRPGVLSWPFHAAARPRDEHAAGDDGAYTTADCADVHPCAPATDLDRFLDECRTCWARLDRLDPPTRWPDATPDLAQNCANKRGPRPAGTSHNASDGQPAPDRVHSERTATTTIAARRLLPIAIEVAAAVVISALGATTGMTVTILGILAIPSISEPLQHVWVVADSAVGACVAGWFANPIIQRAGR